MSKKQDITLYQPSDRDMLKQYPELADYPELKDLKPREVKVAWYIGNPTSPMFKDHKKLSERIKKSAEYVYNSPGSRERAEVKEMLRGQLPHHLEQAVIVMESFSLSHRLRAKYMDEYIFEQLSDIIRLDDVTKAAMDTDDKQKYARLATLVSSEMPTLIRRIEGSHGVTVNNEDSEEFRQHVTVKDLKSRLNEDKTS